MPPPLRKRLGKILTEHAEAIVHGRASVVQERRGDGRPFWRLYLETGSGPRRQRRRVYVGPEGGRELRKAVRCLRRAYWGPYGSSRGFLAALAKETAREAILAQTYRHSHGRTLRARRNVPATERYRAEYRTLSRRLLEAATWPGITEGDYVALRKAADRR
ncbi:MAG: hypothetical protein ACYTFZ_11265 [Planctomycetota bacterium]